MRKKVKASSLPKLVYEVLYKDGQYFSLKKETIFNMIVQGLGFEKVIDMGSDIVDERKTLSFNLNDINTELFPEMLKQSGSITESDFLRKIFLTYINLHPSLRERVLYKDLFLKIEQAIKEKKKLKIYINKKVLDIVPIALERNPETNYNCLKARVGEEIFLYEMKDIEKILK